MGLFILFCLIIFMAWSVWYAKTHPEEMAKERAYEEQKKHPKNAQGQVCCPKCGSTQIQMVNRKWSATTGLLTNKVDRVCMNCKNKF